MSTGEHVPIDKIGNSAEHLFAVAQISFDGIVDKIE
jgi:hypothetical protein